jgi:hypothetical protein
MAGVGGGEEGLRESALFAGDAGDGDLGLDQRGDEERDHLVGGRRIGAEVDFDPPAGDRHRIAGDCPSSPGRRDGPIGGTRVEDCPGAAGRPEFGGAPLADQPPGGEDPDPVRDLLDLAEEVGREQDGAPGGPDIGQQGAHIRHAVGVEAV